MEFRPEHVDAYKAQRRNGAGTARRVKVGETAIRRELEVLNRAFTHDVEHLCAVHREADRGQRARAEIPLERFPAILAAIDCPDTRDLCEWLLLTATRPKGARDLRWEWFDREKWTLKVPGEKGGNARTFAIEGTLRRVIERRLAVRRLDCPFIFHHGGRRMSEKRDRLLGAGSVRFRGGTQRLHLVRLEEDSSGAADRLRAVGARRDGLLRAQDAVAL